MWGIYTPLKSLLILFVIGVAAIDGIYWDIGVYIWAYDNYLLIIMGDTHSSATILYCIGDIPPPSSWLELGTSRVCE